MIDVSVIIVTWNNEDEISVCIDSVISNIQQLSVELIVIDNASGDKTFDILKNINYSNVQSHRNENNLGYTKAVNQGINLAKGEYIFLLNPDTKLHENCLNILYNFLETNSSYSADCPMMLNEDGSVQHSIRNFPTYWTMFCEFTLLSRIFSKSKLLGKWKFKYFPYDEDADVNQPMAAALMIRKNALAQIGNMDEHFEMFFNDVDICKRIIDSGLKIRFIKNAVIKHKHGASVYKDRKRMIKIWNDDCGKYFRKYYPNTSLLLWLKLSLKISSIIRIALLRIVINKGLV